MEFAKSSQDLGVKFFNLVPSNFKKWNADVATEAELIEQISIFQQPLSETAGDSYSLLLELLLKAGFPLSSSIEKKVTSDGIPYCLVENKVVFALEKIGPKLLEDVEELKPVSLVVLGSLFEGEKADEIMNNWKLQLDEAGIDFKKI